MDICATPTANVPPGVALVVFVVIQANVVKPHGRLEDVMMLGEGICARLLEATPTMSVWRGKFLKRTTDMNVQRIANAFRDIVLAALVVMRTSVDMPTKMEVVVMTQERRGVVLCAT